MTQSAPTNARAARRLALRREARARKTEGLTVGDQVKLAEDFTVGGVLLREGTAGVVDALTTPWGVFPFWAARAPLIRFGGATGITESGAFLLPVPRNRIEIGST